MFPRVALAALLLLLSSIAQAQNPENWPAGTEAPDWWPAPVALYPGSTIEEVDHAKDKGLPGIESLVPVDGATVEGIEEWYRTMLEEAGWEVWETKEITHGLRFTSQNRDLDQRIIVQIFRPKHFLFNKSENPLVKITVYRSIPA